MLVDRVEASAIEVEIWQCLRESNMIWLQESWKEDHEKKDATWWNKGQEKEDQGMKVQKVPNGKKKFRTQTPKR